MKDFRARAHELVDWMADYLESIEEHPIVPSTHPGDVRDALPARAPESGEPFEAIFQDFQDLIVPNMTHWNHPGWFAYFPANHSPPSILAEMLVTAMGAQCMSWQTSPAATELEQRVMDWLRQLVGLPETFTGVIQDTASTSTLVALLSARERATQHGFGKVGASAEGASRMTVYATEHAHSSIDKGVKLAGFGLERMRRVGCDDTYAMDPEALRSALAADVDAGMLPACVLATIGTTSSTAIDPIPSIAEVCQEFGVWLHVDGAYAGACGLLEECAPHFAGLEHADSYVFNPHKWLFVNLDCSAYFVRDVDHLLHTFQTNPEYLKTRHDAEVVNYRDWGIQLGRRFRALKLWFVLRSYGAEALREILRAHLQMAHDFARRVDAHPQLELMAPAPFGLVCFRAAPKGMSEEERDGLNAELLADLNARPDIYLTHTKLAGRMTLRLSVGQLNTRPEHVERVWNALLGSIAARSESWSF
ncbi:MAG: pyridoxal-dependent decarboxylase [Myxococcota bacterium]